ncbi:MAG: elongation factor G [Sandaracinaceae bacterium]
MTRLRRNLGIIAHVDAGKTTLTERILFGAGRIHRMGNVDAGNTITDTEPEERQKGITLGAAAVCCEHRGHALTLVDTPGHADFTMEVERSLRVLDGAVVLLDAVAGVEPQTEKVWRQAERWSVPRIAFVNKLDRVGADLDRTLASIRERLGATPVLLTLPMGLERDFSGVVDLVRRRALRFDDEGRAVPLDAIPDAMQAEVEAARAALLEACAEVDADFLAKWVDGSATDDDVIAALRRATARGTLLPTLVGSALANRGVPPLLDAVVDLLPAPHEGPALVDVRDGRTRERSVDAPLAALCFKVAFDAHGALAWVRVYAGSLRTGDVVAVGEDDRMRVGRLVRLFADRREPVEEARAGDVVAIVGADVVTGQTLAALDDRMLLTPIRPPESVMRVAIEPRTRADRDRLPKALERLRIEDPSMSVTHDPETGQTMLAGMGQLHLEVRISRLMREHRVELAVGAPKVAFRETIGRGAEVVHLHKKQSGGPGEWAKVALRIEPAAPGEGLVFEDRIRGGVIPSAWVPAVFAGCREAAQVGPIEGYPVVDVRVILLDGATHSDDSSEMAFHKAGRDAFRLALADAGPYLLEPLMRVEVRVPPTHVGDVVGDVARRRGRVIEIAAEGTATQVVVGEVPLAELFGFAGDLSNLTHGRGVHHLELARYARAG